MDVIVVGITRAFGRHCIGAFNLEDGTRIRLVPPPNAANDQYVHDSDQFWPTNHPYTIGTTWRIDGRVPNNMHPPHTENVIVLNSQHLGQVDIRTYMQGRPQSWRGNMQEIFDRKLHITNGKLYTSYNNPPTQSTGEWVSDRDFSFYHTNDGYRYRFACRGEECSVKYVGIQPQIDLIPQGTLMRFSLAKPLLVSSELRCYLQLSGWF